MVSEQVAWDFFESDLENFQAWKLYNLPGNLFHCWTVLTGKSFSLYPVSTHLVSPYACCLSSYPHTPLRRPWLCLLSASHRCRELLGGPPTSVSSPAWTSPVPLASPPRGSASAPDHRGGSAELAPVCQWLSCTGVPKLVAVSRCGLMSAK